jgi:tetratricopeptide (TPR) repeat protein
MRKILLLLLILPGIIFGQYNEKEILKKQASSMISRRQYEQANRIYEKIMQDYPVDASTTELYITNLLRISKFKLAEDKLAQYNSILPSIAIMRMKLPILIGKGNFKEARKTALDFLDENKGNIVYYHNVAQIFSQYRQNETAIEIYEMVREIAKDDYLYTREVAQSYSNARNYDKAIVEYFKLLEKQSGYSNYILNRLQTILLEDTKYIKTIKLESKDHPDPNARELYALCLAAIGKFELALQQYDELDAEKLNTFARKMKIAGNLDVAEMGYTGYLKKVNDSSKIANAKIELAETLIMLRRFNDAKEILLQVYNNKEIKKSNFKYRTKANRQCRELLADLVLREKGNEKEVVTYLEEAKQFTFNQVERNEIEFKIINLLMLIENYEESRMKLANLLKTEDPGTDTFKKGYLYSYLLAVFQKDAIADSLLGEIIINLPEDEAANDALLLANLIPEMSPEDVDIFLAAYRQKLIYRVDEAITLLQELYDNSSNEEMLFLAGEWAREAGNDELALSFFSHQYQNDIIGEYVQLQLTEIADDQEMKNEFLLSNPQSVFSPKFRMIVGN